MSEIIQFESNDIRRVWNEEDEQWYFAAVDVIAILTESKDPGQYWRRMKQREPEVGTICTKFPLKNPKNNRTYQTDCANREGVFRIIQSMPSPNVEPFKRWLARVGNERIEEIQDPSKAIDRAREYYRMQGRDEEWITARLKSKDVRDELTDEWDARGIEQGKEYAILTAEISRGTFDITPSEHKKVKGLKKQNLRDHMSSAELVFTMLGELSTTQIARNDDAQGFDENKKAARRGGQIAGNARRELEAETGDKVVTSDNFLPEDKQPSLFDEPKDE